MKHIRVILFSYFLSIFLAILPFVILEGALASEELAPGAFRFIYYTAIGFPLILIFMSLHHLVLYILLKKAWFQMTFCKRILIGSAVGFIYIGLLILINFSWEILIYVPFFTYFAIIYELASWIMRKANRWTLFNPQEE